MVAAGLVCIGSQHSEGCKEPEPEMVKPFLSPEGPALSVRISATPCLRAAIG